MVLCVLVAAILITIPNQVHSLTMGAQLYRAKSLLRQHAQMMEKLKVNIMEINKRGSIESKHDAQNRKYARKMKKLFSETFRRNKLSGIVHYYYT